MIFSPDLVIFPPIPSDDDAIGLVSATADGAATIDSDDGDSIYVNCGSANTVSTSAKSIAFIVPFTNA